AVLSPASAWVPLYGDSRVYSRLAAVFGPIRPRLLASWPVHHIEPSCAARGSCGREPCVGTSHKSMRALTGPDRITADGRARSGKLFIRYSVIAGHSSGGTGVSTFCIMRTTVSHPFGV